MSWWNLPGHRDDVIGDEPADIIAEALGRATALGENSAGRAAAFPDVLAALGQAITQTAGELEDPPPAGGRVVGVTSTGEIEPGHTAQDLVMCLADGIPSVAAAYRDRFGRRPRLIELLAVFAFVLRPDYPELRDLEIRQA